VFCGCSGRSGHSLHYPVCSSAWRFAGIFGPLLALGNGIGMCFCFVWSEGYITESEKVYVYRVIPYSSEHSDSYVQLSDYQPKFSILSTLKRLNIIRTEPLDIYLVFWHSPPPMNQFSAHQIAESPVDDELCSKAP